MRGVEERLHKIITKGDYHMQNTRKRKITTRILTMMLALMVLLQPVMNTQAALTADRAIAKGIDVSK